MPSSPDVVVPGPDPREIELQERQIAALEAAQLSADRQRREQDILRDLVLETEGFQAVRNSRGDLVGVRRTTTELDEKKKEAEAGLVERTLKALAGELDIDPALENEIAQADERFQNELIRDFGSIDAAQSSTAGQARIRAHEQTTASIRENARRGQLELSEGLALARSQSNQSQVAQQLGSIFGVSQFPGQQFQSQLAVAGGFDPALARSFGNRQLGLQAQIANANRPSTFDAILGLGGTIAGAAFGNPSFGLFA